VRTRKQPDIPDQSKRKNSVSVICVTGIFVKSLLLFIPSAAIDLLYLKNETELEGIPIPESSVKIASYFYNLHSKDYEDISTIPSFY
jgi:hypothetical protein